MIGVEQDTADGFRSLVLVLDDRNFALTEQEYVSLLDESIDKSNDEFVSFWQGYAETKEDFDLIDEVWQEHLKDYHLIN